MRIKIFASMLITIMLITMTISALALPKPSTAYYPQGGMLTLSPVKESNNTYAFKATGKTDSKVLLNIDSAYADQCGTVVTIQMFVVNKWGNWISFGAPETLVLDCEPSSHEYRFTIRQKKEFCIKVSSYGINGNCVIPYQVTTI